MKIVLTEITKLHGGKCCVAGICREDGKLYRLSDPYATHAYVLVKRWRVGTELDGEFLLTHPTEPVHCEDSRWSASRTGRIADGDTLKNLFVVSTVSSLPDSLGITARGTPVADFSPKGRSIVTIQPSYISIERKEPYKEGGKPSVRAVFCCCGSWMRFVPITDIRFFNLDGTINDAAVAIAQRHVESVRAGEEEVFVRVGVTRPFDPAEAGNLSYWVQIDGLHFFSKTTGKYVRDFCDEVVISDVLSGVSENE